MIICDLPNGCCHRRRHRHLNGLRQRSHHRRLHRSYHWWNGYCRYRSKSCGWEYRCWLRRYGWEYK